MIRSLWSTEYTQLSKQHKDMVRRFYTAQQELSLELSGAKPLGICKTSISGRNPLNSKNHILTTISGPKSMIDTFTSRNVSKEMLF